MTENLDKYGREYPEKYEGYLVPRSASDAIAIKEAGEGEFEILLITRKKATF